MRHEPKETVLIVEDERTLADLYAKWLHDDYEVRTAYDGREALAKLDDTVSIVLLDRRLPDMAGDDILTEVRDRSLNCRVAMVTAIEPELDIVDMGFDDYLVKPIDKEELQKTVEWLIDLSEYDDIFQEYFALASKVGVLEAEHDDDVLASSEEYAEVTTRLDSIQQEEEAFREELNEAGPSDRIFRRMVANWDRTSAATSE